MNMLKHICVPQEYIEHLIEKYGGERQPAICIEELSELQKELCKHLRGVGVKPHITEEIAHVLISTSVIIELMDIDVNEIQQHIIIKMLGEIDE